MKNRIFIPAVVVIFLLTVNTLAQQNADLAPCALLPQADAERIAGVKLRLESNDRIENESECYYATEDKEIGVSLILRVYPSRRAARGFFMGNRELFANTCVTYKLVAGVGESAWFCSFSETTKDIAVLQNAAMFQLSVTRGNYPVARLKSDARRLAARIRNASAGRNKSR